VSGTVFVVNRGLDIGSALAAGLHAAGECVVLLSEGGDLADGDDLTRVSCPLTSREDVERALAQASARAGAPDQVVACVIPAQALQACPVHELEPARWQAVCRDAIKTMLHVLQAAFVHLSDRGGSFVVLAPALSLAGAERLVPLSTALEGQRGLVKSAARQWGRRGVTVNWVAAAPHALSPAFDGLPLHVKPDSVPVALERVPTPGDGLAGVVRFLGSAPGRALTGATVVADGGAWMVP
jgi:NAD(P)-dependent dehydrogenase (short-subunit alcohol dehydrogenase family)